MERNVEHQARRMVAELKRDGWVRSDSVERALLRVERDRFVSPVGTVDAPLDAEFYKRAYDPTRCIVIRRDDSAPDHGVSCVSAPDIVAVMLELLEVAPGMRTLEIGTGSGYNAALLAELAGQENVYTIEQYTDVAQAAQQRLLAVGLYGVHVIRGDGGYGYAAGSPYDRMIATASVRDVPPPWFDQLAQDGQLVVTWRTASGATPLLKLRRTSSTSLQGDVVQLASFMALHGDYGHPESSDDIWFASARHDLHDALDKVLSVEQLPANDPDPLSDGLLLYLCLEEPGIRYIVLDRDSPATRAAGAAHAGCALWMPESASLAIIRHPDLKVLCCGHPAAGERVLHLSNAWSARGKPVITDFEVAVHRGSATLPSGGAKRWRLRLDWNSWEVRLRG